MRVGKGGMSGKEKWLVVVSFVIKIKPVSMPQIYNKYQRLRIQAMTTMDGESIGL